MLAKTITRQLTLPSPTRLPTSAGTTPNTSRAAWAGAHPTSSKPGRGHDQPLEGDHGLGAGPDRGVGDLELAGHLDGAIGCGRRSRRRAGQSLPCCRRSRRSGRFSSTTVCLISAPRRAPSSSRATAACGCLWVSTLVTFRRGRSWFTLVTAVARLFPVARSAGRAGEGCRVRTAARALGTDQRQLGEFVPRQPAIGGPLQRVYETPRANLLDRRRGGLDRRGAAA